MTKISVVNPDPAGGAGKFEAGTQVDGDYWRSTNANVTVSLDTAIRRSGFQSLRLTRITSNGGVSVFSSVNASPFKFGNRNLMAGRTLKSSIWVRLTRAGGAGTTLTLTHRYLSGNSTLADDSGTAVAIPTGAWVNIENSSAIPAGTTSVSINISTTGITVGDFVNIDDVEMWIDSPVWTPTTDQILNLDGVRRRSDSFRFELCDRELNPIGELHPDRSSTPSISVDTTNSSSRRLSGLKITPDEMEDINVLSDRLRVYMTLQNGEEFRLGTFLWADASNPVRSWGIEHHAELVDYSYILNQPSTRPWSWNRNANPIGLIIIFLIQRVGFQLADIAVIGDEANRGLSDPLSWEPGATWAQILTDICNILGFAPPWFDRDGRLHFDQPPDPAKDMPTVPAYGDATRILKDSVVRTSDMLSAPNDFAVFDSGTSGLRVGRRQVPTAAPHSFSNRGFRIGLVETVQGLTSKAQADKAALNLARTKSEAFEWLSFDSTLDPRHDVYDVVDAFGQRWLETSWDMELRSGGKMSHTMKRTTYDIDL